MKHRHRRRERNRGEGEQPGAPMTPPEPHPKPSKEEWQKLRESCGLYEDSGRCFITGSCEAHFIVGRCPKYPNGLPVNPLWKPSSYEECPDRRDDSYMEGEGEFYCKQYNDNVAFFRNGAWVEPTFSCNYNLENRLCPRGFP